MTKYLLICLVVCALIFQGCWHHESAVERGYNEKYIGEYTRKIAFPIGGIGTGMFCIEGTGALSNMSIRHRPNVFNEPTMFCCNSCGSLFVSSNTLSHNTFLKTTNSKRYKF